MVHSYFINETKLEPPNEENAIGQKAQLKVSFALFSLILYAALHGLVS